MVEVWQEISWLFLTGRSLRWNLTYGPACGKAPLHHSLRRRRLLLLQQDGERDERDVIQL